MKEEKQNKNNKNKNTNIEEDNKGMDLSDLNLEEIEFEIIDDVGYNIEQFLCRCSSKTTDVIC